MLRPPLRGRSARLGAWALFLVVSCYLVSHWTLASYGVRAITPLLAAYLLLRSGGAPELARPRRWTAAALVAGATSGVLAAAYWFIESAGLGSPAVDLAVDWLGMSYVPFALAAVLSLPVARGGSRWGSIANGAIAAGSLWYLALVLLVEPNTFARSLGVHEWSLMGYILVPTFVGAALLSVLPRATAAGRSFAVPLAVALTVMTVSDVSYAVSSLAGTYQSTTWIAVVNQAALACFVLAGMHRSHPGEDDGGQARRLSSTVRAALPYLPLVIALVVTLVRYLQGASITNAQMLPVMVIGAGIVLRHLSTVAEHDRLTAGLVSSRLAAEAEALRDPLTGLANRRAFVAGLGERIGRGDAPPVAVALIDLNDFKDVNDTHGHGTGDLLLRECAARLRACLPDGALVARLGGDEFALCDDSAGGDGATLGRAVATAFASPVVLGSRRFVVRPSIGIVLDERADRTGGTGPAEELLSHADVAMYQAKADKTVYAAPTVVLTGEARTRAAALIRLREEINDPQLDQFRVVYQPTVDLRTGVVSGVEALVRWRHPTLGEVSPAHFIPLAEQVGSVNVLGDFVMRTAIADLALLHRGAGGRGIEMNVNLSAGQLADPDLPRRTHGLLREQRLAPEQLVLEITEGALVRDLEAAAELVTEMRSLGMSVAVDDFGTGYSSLGYLRRFPVDVLKIDREFIGVLPGDHRTSLVLQSVVHMARALHLKTVAEGIETVEQLEAVKALGCDLGQGYLFSAPVERDVIAQMLAHQGRAGRGSSLQPVACDRRAR